MGRGRGNNAKPIQQGRKPKLSQNFRPDTSGVFDPSQSRVKSLNDWDQDDIQDEQDDFFEGTDKISLDRTNDIKASEHDLDIPEQLLDIKATEDESEDYDEEEEIAPKAKKERKPKAQPDNSQKGRFGKVPSPEAESDADSSKESVDQALVSSNEDSSDDGSSGDDEETWKSYHVAQKKSKNKKRAMDVDAQHEEAERRAMELEEVKRLQLKARSKLVTSDFKSYLDYASDDELTGNETVKKLNKTGLSSQSAMMKEFASDPEAIAYLLKVKPECLALVNDFRRSLVSFAEVQEEVFCNEPSDENPGKNEFKRAVNWLHYHVLSTYLSTTAFYMHLALKMPAANPSVVAAVTRSLVELRNTLNLMDQVGLIGDNPMEDDDMLDLSDDLHNQFATAEFDQELRNLLYDQSMEGDESNDSASLLPTKKRQKANSSLATPRDHEESSKPQSSRKTKTKKRKRASEPDIEDPNKSLQSLPPRPSISSLAQEVTSSQDIDNDFIEPTSLSASEASEKSNKKKNLRFYTSKIDAKGKRREKAINGSGAVGGDTDLPYITKEAQRREFLRQQDHSGADEDRGGMEDNSDYEDGFHSMGDSHAAGEEMDYYSTLKELKDSAKLAKKAKHDERKMAERDALTLEGDSGSGPREVTRQILKNKGLTPKRPKENRNPRVKKRLRFEKAKKKISSQRPTYKSDQAAKSRELNGYTGEKSGVKVGVVKSRKL